MANRLNTPITTGQNQPPEPKKKHHGMIVSLLIVIAFGITGYLGFKQFNKLNEIDTPSSMITFAKSNQTNDKFVMEYYYQPGCKDCKDVDRAGIQQLLKKASVKNQLVIINTKKFRHEGSSSSQKMASQWFTNNYVTETPTLIVKYKGMPLYTYAGTNIKIYQKLLQAKNPQTGKPFPKKKPTHEVYQNDFTKSKQNFISVNPLSAD